MNAKLAKYWVQLTAEPRKAVILGVLAVVALVMITRSVLLAGGPSQASASVRSRATGATSPTPADAKQTIVFRALAPIRDADAPPLYRDIFALNEDRFPPVRPNNAANERGAKSGVGNDDIADEPTSAQRVEERVRTLAQGLRLRSTLMGAKPMAVIEHGAQSESGGAGARRSDVVALHDAVAGFTLVEVTRHWVDVEMEGVRVRLELPAPMK